ncbi:MAG: phosphoketolase, partial [Actinomycetes bacterium]
EDHREVLERWLRSYRPEELFDEAGTPIPAISALHPAGQRRLSANPHANGGLLLRDLRIPDFTAYAVPVDTPGTGAVESTRVLGTFLRDIVAANMDNFRVFAPDENNSNRLGAIFDATDRSWNARTVPEDDHLARDGRVMEILSEHTCQGWLEGYLLSGRHGFFSCYEAFIHIVDSMFNQHAKWLKVHRQLPWRQPVASLNYLLSSHVWQQDHNGFSHQDPGFIDHAVNKKAEVIRVYLPPDANTLLYIMQHCLASTDYVNIVVSGKQPSPTWLGPEDAANHCRRGLGIWPFAGSEVPGEEPDVVLACAGDVPTVETVAAAELLREGVPGLKVRVVNVVDLMRLQDESEHPHGLPSRDFDGIFTNDKPIIFAYHGYPALIHRLAYRRSNQEGLHVRGYKEEGTTTTPFDMAMLNGIDRFQLAIDAIDRVPGLAEKHSLLRQELQDRRMRARQHTRTHGEDPEEIRNWKLG